MEFPRDDQRGDSNTASFSNTFACSDPSVLIVQIVERPAPSNVEISSRSPSGAHCISSLDAKEPFSWRSLVLPEDVSMILISGPTDSIPAMLLPSGDQHSSFPNCPSLRRAPPIFGTTAMTGDGSSSSLNNNSAPSGDHLKSVAGPSNTPMG